MSDEPQEIDTVNAGRTAERAAFEITRLMARAPAPGLHIVATPIGNLADISLRALATLAQADVVYCEDTRHSRTLLAHYSIATRLRPYHEHNAEEERPRVLAALAEGRSVALISDAGTPLVSDPGYKLVREAVAAGHAVTAVPGASAALAALTLAGLPTDAFFFAGFLPPKEGARRSRIAELATLPGTLVLFESPNRVAATLGDLADGLGPREAALARELTKLHEEVRRGPLAALAEGATRDPPKGEVVLLVAPATTQAVSDDMIAERLVPALANLSLRDAAKAVAEAMKVPRARVYDIALGLKRHGET